jgi:probable rRNA maturation factor
MAPGDLCRVRGRSVNKGSGRFFGSQARKNLPDPILSKLSVIVTDERGRPVPAGGLARWLTRVAPARARGAVGIALVSDARVRALNREYRGHDYPTDVLSFPASGSPRPPPPLADQTGGRRSGGQPRVFHLRPRSRKTRSGAAAAGAYLGDIVIARGVARRQAHAVGHDEPTELRVLALHGLLHLLGYDHERDRGTMARVERRLRRKGGLAEGLLDRATLRRGTAGR